MIAAGFSGGEAEELRRAMGFKRSEKRMQEIEKKLRAGMERNGISHDAQELIVEAITSFALYGFPESHAASFALLAYASAYLKCHYLAAFTAALLNNQPMGFYHPSTIVKDAQRHGLKIRPIDVAKSDWPCTLEPIVEAAGNDSYSKDEMCMRLGLRYVRGLREEAAKALVAQRQRRPFASIQDLIARVPALRKDELQVLAEVGALNYVGSDAKFHRRDALWQVARSVRHPGELLENIPEKDVSSPLSRMNPEERLVADFRGTGLTVGPHPMAYHRSQMEARGVRKAIELHKLPDGKYLKIAGCVIARQRPGTASGFVFLSLEDETGIANAIITPKLFDQHRIALVKEQFLLIEGWLQNLDNVISVKANKVLPLRLTNAPTESHDFH